jgi:general stress protein YciG
VVAELRVGTPVKSSSGDEGTGTGGRNTVAKEDRGFASMDRSKQREIASKGGKAAHQKGTAHEWTSEEARDAGRKGGIASHRRRREQTGGPETEESRPSDFESQPRTSDDQPDRPVE